MSTLAWETFEQRLACEDSWHAESHALAWPVPEATMQRLNERSVAALTTIASLEERRADGADDDSAVMQELARLDAKLNALIDMVNRLATPADALPPRQPLRFNAIGAVLPPALVPPGEALLLRLRFDACPGMPLELPAQVERRFDDGSAFVAFSLSDGVAASLERLVFRHHRRKVAGARQSAN